MGHHHHHHDHSHHVHHHHANKTALILGFFITFSFMMIEAIGGLLTKSLALLSDAGHMLSDSLSLGIAVLAFTFARKVANYEKTFGYRRLEIFAAVVNGISLIVIAVVIYFEAYERFLAPAEIASTGMLVIASIGLMVNILVAWILHRGDTEENLNVRAAFLHVLGDLLGSVGAIIASLLIMFFGWTWADPLASVIVATLVLISGIRVTRESLHILMEGTPKNVSVEEVIATITGVPDVLSIHDLHIWSITSGHHALSCHAVVAGDLTISEAQTILDEMEHRLSKLGIQHITIQLEHEDHPHIDSILCNNHGPIPVHDHD